MDEEKRPAGQEKTPKAPEAPEKKESPETGAPPRHEWDEPFEDGSFLSFQPPAPPRPAPPDDRAGEAPKKKKVIRLQNLGQPGTAPAGASASQAEGAGIPSEEERKNNRVIRLAAVRRRRNARRTRWIVGLTAALTVAIAGMLGAFAPSLAALSDLVDTVRIGLTPGEGFPVKTNISDIYQVEELSGGFVELGKQDLVLYSASGARLRSIQHNYSRPALTAGKTRFCYYARSGNELRVESRSRNLYTKTTDQPLLLCSMSENGSLAVVTRASRAAAELSVYSPRMEYLYGWQPTEKEGTPVRIAFAEDNKHLAVACLKASEGRLATTIYFMHTGRDELQAVTNETGATPLEMTWLDSSQLLVVFDDHTAVYNTQTGEEKYRYEYEGSTLLSSSVNGRTTALLIDGGAGLAQSRLVLLDDCMEPQAEVYTSGEAQQVVCTHTTAYILEESGVSAYSMKGEARWTLPMDTRPLALVDAKKLLLFTGVEADVLDPPRT